MHFRLREFEGIDLGALRAILEEQASGEPEHRRSRHIELTLNFIRSLMENGQFDMAMEFVGLQIRSARRECAPCLLEAVPAGHPDHDWLSDVHAALRSACGKPRVCLQACEAQLDESPSYRIVAIARGTRAQVRTGDVVQSGFALVGSPDEGLTILPRIFRVACANGALTAAGVFGARGVQASEVGEVVAECLSQRVLDAETARLALAAARDVPDPLAVLFRARVTSNMDEVRQEFGRAGDRTGWGLINAVTAVARRTQDWRRRLEQEGDAARILAVLERDPGSRERGAALALPREERLTKVHA